MFNVDIYMKSRIDVQQPYINKDTVDIVVVCSSDEVMSMYFNVVKPLCSMLIDRAQKRII